jgi:hypothetical protein
MSRRFQFSLAAIFKATTLLAALCSVCKTLGGPVETVIVFTVAFLIGVPACFRD